MKLLTIPLGYIMYICYQLTNNYALSIVLFTLATKIILLPVSLWVHKNGIKMVKLMPDLNRIKLRYFGDNDKIADETQALYKQVHYNPLASLVPLFIQIVLLIGLIQVIYNPLTHLFHVEDGVALAISGLACSLDGANPESGSIQLQALQVMQNELYGPEFLALPGVSGELLSSANQLDLSLFGVSLGKVPMEDGGALLCIPALAALAAFIANFFAKLAIKKTFDVDTSKFDALAFVPNTSSQFDWQTHVFYTGMLHQEVQIESEKHFKFIHLEGAHVP